MKQTSLKQILAYIVSRTFDVYVIFPLVIAITWYSAKSSYLWPLYFLVIVVLIPEGGNIYATLKHLTSDWDLSNRVQREKYIEIDALLMLVLLATTLLFHAPKAFLTLAFILFTLEVIFAQITLFWKISIHAQLISLLCLYATVFLSHGYITLFLLLPLIFWARHTLHEHTYLQLCMGSIATIIITLIFFHIFQYI